MNRGKIFLIEGSDCSFKETNSKALYEQLKKDGYNVRIYSYPNYESPSSALVKMYLNEEFGSSASELNPYIMSQFYAVDRVASYLKEWKEFNDNGGIIILDRYVESNSIHQGAKFDKQIYKDIFLDWLHNLEYGINGLPKPDIVFFMDMPPEKAQEIIKNRNNKITDSNKKDIHEKDFLFLEKSYQNAKYVAKKYNWRFIGCVFKGELKSKDEIFNEIYEQVKNVLIK